LNYVQSFLAPANKDGKFELWTDDEDIAGGHNWQTALKEKLDECDVYLLLVSRHSLASNYVAKEIEAILERDRKRKDVSIFPIVLTPVPAAALRQLNDFNLRPAHGVSLSEMPQHRRDATMANIADEIEDLAAKIAQWKFAAPRIAKPSPLIPIDVARLPESPYTRLVGREIQLKQLDAAWTNDAIHVLSLVAEGGAGKSALMNEWLQKLQADNYRGAEAVLGWSFYSQGTKERATSAEQFLNWVIDRLGVKIETTSSTVKGEAIAQAMFGRRVLLLLDGVDPLQHGPGPQIGQLKDIGLRALLRHLAAAAPNATPSLVVLNSRFAIRDIDRWVLTSAPVLNLDQLSDTAGAALLRDNGVVGAEQELRAASREFGGHPLALGLLASYLRETQSGDVRRRDHIRAFFTDEENPRHDHAKRVMESYEREWLAGQPVMQAVMFIIGLFDRPASDDCLRALRAKPVIAGLTEAIADLDENGWRRAVARLREVRLLSPPDSSEPDVLDAHPLVREWFGERLKIANEAAWRAAHGRLYEHLRNTTEEGNLPTLADLAPLYHAITHGCRAGRHQEVLEEVYRDRICRRYSTGELQFYSAKNLGAIGTDLSAISWFFARPYEIVISSLSQADQAWILGQSAFYLTAQGRIGESLWANREALRMDEAALRWRDAAISASDLSQAELLVGEVATAIASAARSVEHADRGGDKFGMVINRVTYADALHAAGRRDEAEALFAGAEQRQRDWQPEFPLLYSVQGFRYCELLLAKAEWSVARERARQTITIARKNNWLLDMALDTLTLGCAHLGLALMLESPSGVFEAARSTRVHIDEAVDGLRAAGQGDYVPAGLLARAAFRRSIGDWDGASRDLDEVEEIAEPGPMKLFLCDMALERARLTFAEIEAFAPLNGLIDNGPPEPIAPDTADTRRLKEEATKQLAIAADYIKTCGYHRRDEELAELEAVLRGEQKFADLPPRV
jgi:tetratricopeptide (TPR) repeat protein